MRCWPRLLRTAAALLALAAAAHAAQPCGTNPKATAALKLCKGAGECCSRAVSAGVRLTGGKRLCNSVWAAMQAERHACSCLPTGARWLPAGAGLVRHGPPLLRGQQVLQRSMHKGSSAAGTSRAHAPPAAGHAPPAARRQGGHSCRAPGSEAAPAIAQAASAVAQAASPSSPASVAERHERPPDSAGQPRHHCQGQLPCRQRDWCHRVAALRQRRRRVQRNHVVWVSGTAGEPSMLSSAPVLRLLP